MAMTLTGKLQHTTSLSHYYGHVLPGLAQCASNIKAWHVPGNSHRLTSPHSTVNKAKRTPLLQHTLQTALSSHLLLGTAGTGKSYLIRALIELLGNTCAINPTRYLSVKKTTATTAIAHWWHHTSLNPAVTSKHTTKLTSVAAHWHISNTN